MAQQIQVGGRLYNPDAKFYYSSGVGGPDLISAEQAARIAPRMNYGKGLYGNYSGGGDSWTDYEGYLDLADAGTPIKKKAPEAAAPAPQRRSAPRQSALTAPAVPDLPAVSDPVQPEEKDAITRPAEGLESTIKTTPTLLRERRRRSYLTRA